MYACMHAYIHTYIAIYCSYIFSYCSTLSWFSTFAETLVSSANFSKRLPVSMWFIKIKNNNGPKIDPWCKPLGSSLHDDDALFNATLCFRFLTCFYPCKQISSNTNELPIFVTIVCVELYRKLFGSLDKLHQLVYLCQCNQLLLLKIPIN